MVWSFERKKENPQRVEKRHADKSFQYKTLSLVKSPFLLQGPYLHDLRQSWGRESAVAKYTGKQSTCHGGTSWGGVFCSSSMS